MARIISVHEYDLTPRSGPAQFEQAIRTAEGRGLFVQYVSSFYIPYPRSIDRTDDHW